MNTIKKSLLTRFLLIAIGIVLSFGIGGSLAVSAQSVDALAAQATLKTLNAAYCFVPTATPKGAAPAGVVVIPGQSYKEVKCTTIFGTGPSFSAGYQFIKSNGCYFVAMGASACDKFPSVGLYLVQYLKGKYPNVPNVGQGSLSQGYITPANSETPSATVTPTATPEADIESTDSSCKTGDTRQECSLDINAFEGTLGTTNKAEDCSGVKISFKVGCDKRYSNPIIAYLVAILRFLTYGVGVVVILMIVVGGIQYTTAGGNAQTVQAARNRILNAFIALLLYIFAFAILNFIVPGGLIS